MRDYTRGNNDDTTKAVKGLDMFTKNWCMDRAKTDELNEPTFRCKQCEFNCEGGVCLVKSFAIAHEHNYPMRDFGWMHE